MDRESINKDVGIVNGAPDSRDQEIAIQNWRRREALDYIVAIIKAALPTQQAVPADRAFSSGALSPPVSHPQSSPVMPPIMIPGGGRFDTRRSVLSVLTAAFRGKR